MPPIAESGALCPSPHEICADSGQPYLSSKVSAKRSTGCARPSEEDIARFDDNPVVERPSPIIEWLRRVIKILDANYRRATVRPIRILICISIHKLSDFS